MSSKLKLIPGENAQDWKTFHIRHYDWKNERRRPRTCTLRVSYALNYKRASMAASLGLHTLLFNAGIRIHIDKSRLGLSLTLGPSKHDQYCWSFRDISWHGFVQLSIYTHNKELSNFNCCCHSQSEYKKLLSNEYDWKLVQRIAEITHPLQRTPGGEGHRISDVILWWRWEAKRILKFFLPPHMIPIIQTFFLPPPHNFAYWFYRLNYRSEIRGKTQTLKL